MNRIGKAVTAGLLCLLTFPTWASAQVPPSLPWPGLETGPFAVGYTVRHEYDHSRTFKQKNDVMGKPTPGEIARPVQISIWYPSETPGTGRRTRVREYYDATWTETDFTLREQEALDASLEEFAGILTIEWGTDAEEKPAVLAALSAILTQETYAWTDADPAEGPFPLVLHLPGYNASPNHHYPLFEFLASHGYVVAAVPNMGAYSRGIDHEGMSLDVQARDLEFAYSVVRGLPFVDAGRVATTGMSWGGMSNVLLASRNANIDAVVTFDGAITMPVELDLLERVPGYSHGDFRAAYLQFLVVPEEASFRPKDLRFWDALRYSDAHQIQFSGVVHDDFGPGNLRLRLTSVDDGMRRDFLEAFTRFLSEQTLSFLDMTLKGSETARSRVGEGMSLEGVPAGMVVRAESKKPVRVPPKPEEFGEILALHGPEVAAELLQAVEESNPNAVVVVSPVLGPLYMEAFQAGELDRALAICRLWAQGMPQDVGPLFSMGRVLRAQGKIPEAIQAYRRILEIGPEHPAAENARAAIREMGGG